MELMIIEKWLLRIVVYSPFLRGRCFTLTSHNKYINTVLIIGKRTEVDLCPPLLDLTHFQSSFILAIKHRLKIRPCTNL